MKKILVILLFISGTVQAQWKGHVGYYQFDYLKSALNATSDTSTNKPLVQGSDGVYRRLSYYPGGGTTPTLQTVTNQGATTTNNVIIGNVGNTMPTITPQFKVANNATSAGANIEINGNGYGRLWLNDYSQTSGSKYFSLINIGGVVSFKRVADNLGTDLSLLEIKSSAVALPQVGNGSTTQMLTIDASHNISAQDIPSGGSSTLTNTYIGVGNSSNALSGSANFTWDGQTLLAKHPSNYAVVAIDGASTFNPSLQFREGGTAKWNIQHIGTDDHLKFYDFTGSIYPLDITPTTGAIKLHSLNDNTGVAKMVTVNNGTLSYQAIPSAVSDGDKGDITVSSSGTTWTIDNLAVTNAKINDVAIGKVTGRTTFTSGRILIGDGSADATTSSNLTYTSGQLKNTGSTFFNGAVYNNVVTLTGGVNTTLDDTYHYVNVDASASSTQANVYLPSTSSKSGLRYVIKKVDNSGIPVVITPSGAQTIEGSSTKTLATQYKMITIYTEGSNWFIEYQN